MRITAETVSPQTLLAPERAALVIPLCPEGVSNQVSNQTPNVR